MRDQFACVGGPLDGRLVYENQPTIIALEEQKPLPIVWPPPEFPTTVRSRRVLYTRRRFVDRGLNDDCVELYAPAPVNDLDVLQALCDRYADSSFRFRKNPIFNPDLIEAAKQAMRGLMKVERKCYEDREAADACDAIHDFIVAILQARHEGRMFIRE